MKRLLALFLTVIMVCTLLPVYAFAADTATLSITDAVGAAAPKEVSMSASASGSGWKWNASTKVLTLTGFKGESIEANTDLKIVLSGANTITLNEKSEFGIKVDGKLTIDKTSSSASDTLTVKQAVTASSSNLIQTGGDSSDKTCVINGGTVTLTNSTSGGSGTGIYYSASVNNDANLNITVPYRGIASRLDANTSGKINITTTGSNAFAAAVNALYAKGSGTVTLNASTPAVTVYDTLNIASSAGDVVLNGYTKVAKDPAQTFSVAGNKKVYGVESYYQGCYSTDPARNPGYYLADSQGNALSSAKYVTIDGQPLAIMDSPLFDLKNLKMNSSVDSTAIINATRGGDGKYTYALKSGSSLPKGLTLDSSTGSVKGIPTAACEAGTYVVVVTDGKGETAQVTVNYSSVKAAEEFLTVGGTSVNVKNDNSGIGWSYKADGRTLTLSGYDGGPIKCDTDLNIVLDGKNTVTLPGPSETGIEVNGKLTIDKKTNSVYDSLTVKQSVTTTSANLIVTGGSGESKACVINGGTVNLQTSTGSKSSVGIKNWAYVNNDANLSITASYRGVGSKLYTNTLGTVNVSTLGKSADSAAVYSLNASGLGAVTLTAPESASTVYGALTVAETAGTVTLKGVTKVLNTPYQNFKLAANKKLQNIDSYYLGYNTTGTAGRGYYLVDENGAPITSAVITTQSKQALKLMDSPIFDIPETSTGAKLNYDIYLLNATRGGAGGYSYSLGDGTKLPTGLELNPSTGTITGTPSARQDAGSFVVVVTDAAGATSSITVNYGQIKAGKVVAPVLSAGNDAATGKVKLTWNTVDGAKNYEIYRSTSKTAKPGDDNWTKIYTASATSTSLKNTSTTVGTTYYYYIKAIGYDSNANNSNTSVSNVVYRCCDLPRPVVTTGNKTSTGKVVIKWDAVDGADKYEIYRSTSIDGEYTKIYTTTGTSLTNTTTEPGVTYYYKVKAIHSNSSANSAYSTVVSRTCDCAQPVVTISNVASSGKIKLTWAKIDGAAKYEIYRATSSGGTYTKIYTTTGTSFTNTSTVAGNGYWYKVKAICAATTDGNSGYSAVVSRTCDCAQPVVTISLSSGHPRLKWTAVDGAAKYEIWRATSKTGEYTKLTTITGTAYTNTSAKAGTTYYYKVKAISSVTSNANSAFSAIVSIKAN